MYIYYGKKIVSISRHANHISANDAFSAFFEDINSYGKASEKRTLVLIVKEIVILELGEVVMNALQNNEVFDVGNVTKAYQVYMLQIIFTLYNAKLNLISR